MVAQMVLFNFIGRISMTLEQAVQGAETSSVHVDVPSFLHQQKPPKKESLLLEMNMSRDTAKAFAQRLGEKFPLIDVPFPKYPPAIKIAFEEVAGNRGMMTCVRVYNTGNIADKVIKEAIDASYSGGVKKTFESYSDYISNYIH